MSRLPILAVASLLLWGMPALAQGDPARGEVIYRPCGACHMIGEGAINRVGPNLNGILGRGVAALEGYDYSDALLAAGAAGDVWSEDALDAFLADARGTYPGTIMAFRGIRPDADRRDLIAFLVEEGGTSAPLPADAELPPEIAAILALEGDIAYGRFLSSECTSCHIGAGGQDIPSIRGLPPAIFVTGLAAYRSGDRQHQVMNTLAARLGDEEIAALAAYFASEAN